MEWEGIQGLTEGHSLIKIGGVLQTWSIYSQHMKKVQEIPASRLCVCVYFNNGAPRTWNSFSLILIYMHVACGSCWVLNVLSCTISADKTRCAGGESLLPPLRCAPPQGRRWSARDQNEPATLTIGFHFRFTKTRHNVDHDEAECVSEEFIWVQRAQAGTITMLWLMSLPTVVQSYHYPIA